LRGVFKRK